MTYSPALRAKAREMRVRRRLSLDEIAARLALPRTTVWSWISDLPLARPRRSTAAQRKGTAAMCAKYALLRAAAYEQGRQAFPVLLAESGFRDFVCVYICEGYKRDRNAVSVANSDPHVVVLCTAWVRRFTARKVTFRVQYHADQDLGELRRFWGDVVAVDPQEIQLLRKSNSNQLAGRTWRSVHGVLTVHTNDTLFRAQLEAWMDCLRRDWA
jgi:hypothetical protein